MAQRKRIPDSEIAWNVIEKDYRANQKSLAQIAREHGISRDRIKRRADNAGWSRNLSGKIGEEVQNKLNEHLATLHDELPECSTQEEKDQQIVEYAAITQVELVRSHREDISLLRSVSKNIAAKLDEAVTKGVTIRMVDETGEPTGEPIMEGMDLETAGKVFNNITNGFQRLVQLERQAFGLDKEDDSAGGASKEMQTAMDMILSKTEGLPSETAAT